MDQPIKKQRWCGKALFIDVLSKNSLLRSAPVLRHVEITWVKEMSSITGIWSSITDEYTTCIYNSV